MRFHACSRQKNAIFFTEPGPRGFADPCTPPCWHFPLSCPCLEALQPNQPGLLPRESRAKPAACLASCLPPITRIFPPVQKCQEGKHDLDSHKESLDGTTCSLPRAVQCRSYVRECPAAQKVSYLRPPSQLSIRPPTIPPTCCFSKRTALFSLRFRPRPARFLGRSS